MASFPSSLPCALHNDYGLNTVSPLMRVDLQSGRARQRRRFTNVPTMVAVSWVMNNAQAALFEAWFRWTINDGASWFDMPLKTPMGYQDYDCRFTGMYDGPRLIGAGKWTFTATLEIRERQTFSEEWMTILPEYIGEMDIFDLAVNREWPLA